MSSKRIVSRYRSMVGKGFVFEDGLLENLQKASFNRDGVERFEFKGSNHYIGLDSMRFVNDKIADEIETLDAEIAELQRKAWELKKTRRDLLEKNYSKFKKVYKWDLAKEDSDVS